MPDGQGQDMDDPNIARDAMAGELALGVLEGEERAVALRRLLAEPDFARDVEDWQTRLAPMLDAIPAVEAPAGAWSAIAARIDGVASVAVARWRALALATSAVAACLAVALVWRPAAPLPPPPAPPEMLLAQLGADPAKPLVTAQYDATSGRLRVRTANMPAGEKAPELWVIGADATPRSLGFVPLEGPADYAIDAGLRRRLIDGVTIAVTLEPRSATPHAAPSSAPLGTARLTLV
ncbi:anti-sigma factor [Sphingomonas donggukensis]|uniref:Anti-sigma factor n=1 Tax=Sphingomonas donggukensis TaxID=2949093 RepID=A0ABY4TQI1_9SPHN|nr:anti-sigma factor [Sphingomonas donggukensis]URW74651.1 anti-sigma factor [Sphingomonas donggukensis]